MRKKAQPLGNTSDREFMERVYQEHARLILAIAKKYTTDSYDQEDIMQSVAENLIKHVSTLKKLEKKALAAYIVYAVRNTAINWSKATRRRNKLFVSAEDEEAIKQIEYISQTDPVEEAVLTREQLLQLSEIWHDIPEEDQLLLEGKYIWGLTNQELAEDFNCKPDSVRMKLTRARRKAAQLLQEREEV